MTKDAIFMCWMIVCACVLTLTACMTLEKDEAEFKQISHDLIDEAIDNAIDPEMNPPGENYHV